MTGIAVPSGPKGQISLLTPERLEASPFQGWMPARHAQSKVLRNSPRCVQSGMNHTQAAKRQEMKARHDSAGNQKVE